MRMVERECVSKAPISFYKNRSFKSRFSWEQLVVAREILIKGWAVRQASVRYNNEALSQFLKEPIVPLCFLLHFADLHLRER